MGAIECDGRIGLPALMATPPHGVQLVRELHFKHAMPHVLGVLSRRLSSDCAGYGALTRQLAFLRPDGTFRALQCAACGFGPLLTAFCDDLETHHGQEVAGGSRYSNACPRCGTLHERASEMDTWDGETDTDGA